MQRIGVFVCHCGSNIAATVDVKKVVEMVQMEPGVVHAEDYGETQKGWTADDAKGFIKVTSTALRAYYANHKDEKENI